MNSNLLTIQERAANIMKAVGGNTEKIDLEKSEGSHGGNVIGHTKSGKPIYYRNTMHSKHFHHEKGLIENLHRNFTSEDHLDASKIHKNEASKKMKESKMRSIGSDRMSYSRELARGHEEIASEHEKLAKQKSKD